MSRILSLTLSIALLIGITILILGYTALPIYRGEIEFQVPYSVGLTWQELLNIKEASERKSDVKSVQILEEFGKLSAWQENLNTGGYRIYRMNKRDEQKLLIVELTESSYGLTGIWTFELSPHPDGTTILISEDSTLTDIKRRGYRVIMGKDVDLLSWQKYIKVGLWQTLLKTP
jgi:hypothetical protein